MLGIGVALLFIQCNEMDITTPSQPEGNDTPDELSSPELISPVDGAENQSATAELKWKQTKGAEEYHIQVSESDDFAEVLIDSVSESTSLKTETLTAETTYFWKVAPLSEENMGPWSETWQFSTAAEELEPMSVELRSPEDGADLDETITFEWESLDEASGYHMQLSADEEFKSLVVDSVSQTTSLLVDNLTSSGNYFWRVNPNLSSAPSEWSEIRSFSYTADQSSSTPAATLVAPENGTEEMGTSLTLKWEEIDNVEEYVIHISTDDQYSDLVAEATESATAYEAENLDHDQNYFWRVRAAGNEEKWSDSWTFRTKPDISNDEPPATSSEFVSAQDGNFVLNGEVFRFAGTNAYYLPNYEKWDPGMVNRALNLFEDTGISVVRMWAFYDGYDCGYSRNNPNENVIQTAPGEYSEEALQDLDRVIAKGKERGIRFILPFINYWNELGGVCQYNTWAGASNPSRNMEFFLNNEDTQRWYRDYIEMLLNRVNTVTGVKYKDEPAIFAWQIIAEGRNKGADPRIMRDWYQEIAQYIKSIDSNHMVATGEEGFDNGTPSVYQSHLYNSNYVLNANEGTSYTMNTAIPEIDYGNAHWYPEDWGMGSGLNLTTQEAWIKDHKNIAESHGKPFILGEYGHLGWGDSSVLAGYEALWGLAEEIQLDGSTLWQLTADHNKCYEFGGNICYPGGRGDTALYNSFRNHIENMSNSK